MTVNCQSSKTAEKTGFAGHCGPLMGHEKQAGLEGFEPPTGGLEIRCAPDVNLNADKSCGKGPSRPDQIATKPPEFSPELARVIDLWPGLPEPIRRAILALVDSTAG